MNEEQFVNIDLTDDSVCSVCKLGTEQETLSFCHVCFELNIEGKEPIWASSAWGAFCQMTPCAEPRRSPMRARSERELVLSGVKTKMSPLS